MRERRCAESCGCSTVAVVVHRGSERLATHRAGCTYVFVGCGLRADRHFWHLPPMCRRGVELSCVGGVAGMSKSSLADRMCRLSVNNGGLNMAFPAGKY